MVDKLLAGLMVAVASAYADRQNQYSGWKPPLWLEFSVLEIDRVEKTVSESQQTVAAKNDCMSVGR